MQWRKPDLVCWLAYCPPHCNRKFVNWQRRARLFFLRHFNLLLSMFYLRPSTTCPFVPSDIVCSCNAQSHDDPTRWSQVHSGTHSHPKRNRFHSHSSKWVSQKHIQTMVRSTIHLQCARSSDGESKGDTMHLDMSPFSAKTQYFKLAGDRSSILSENRDLCLLVYRPIDQQDWTKHLHSTIDGPIPYWLLSI